MSKRKQWVVSLPGVEEVTSDTVVAVLTWGAVAAISLIDLSKAKVGQGVLVLAAGLLVIYAMALLAVATRFEPSRRRAWICLGLEFLSVTALYLITALPYVAILMVIWSAQLSWFVETRLAVLAAMLASLPLLVTQTWFWGSPQGFRVWLLFTLFNVFAAVMMQLVRREQAANRALKQSRQELEHARDMLSKAGREAEQMRLQLLRNGAIRVESLTARELEILRLAASGCSNRQIADILCRSEGTVKNHFTAIFGKLGVADRTQAVVLALSEKMLDEEPLPSSRDLQ